MQPISAIRGISEPRSYQHTMVSSPKEAVSSATSMWVREQHHVPPAFLLPLLAHSLNIKEGKSLAAEDMDCC